MVDLNEPVAFFLLIMSIILITPLLSERVRLPGIIGIILGGMLIGPHVFGLIEAGDRMVFLSTIGLVYLMFSAGWRWISTSSCVCVPVPLSLGSLPFCCPS